MADSSEISLSVDETNALRAKLGLPPLRMGKEESAPKAEKQEPSEEEKRKAKKEADDLRERLQKAKDDRARREALLKVSFDDDDEADDDLMKWVQKTRKKQAETLSKEKEMNDKKKADSNQYTSKDLAGMSIRHDVDDFAAGETVVLTLKDQYIVNDDVMNATLNEDEDELENAEMMEMAKAKWSQRQRNLKPGEYMKEEEDDAAELEGSERMLSKYNDDMYEYKAKKTRIGTEGSMTGSAEAKKAILDEKLKNAGKLLVNLGNEKTEFRQAEDYLTKSEMTEFKKKSSKKVKKKKKRVKQKSVAELLEETQDGGAEAAAANENANGDEHHGSRKDRQSVAQREVESVVDGYRRYESALSRAKAARTEGRSDTAVDDSALVDASLSRLDRLRRQPVGAVDAELPAANVDENGELAASGEPDEDDGGIVLDATTEFVLNLPLEDDGAGDAAADVAHDSDDDAKMEEADDTEAVAEKSQPAGDDGDAADDVQQDDQEDGGAVIEDEVKVGRGLAGALGLLKQTGQLGHELEESKRTGSVFDGAGDGGSSQARGRPPKDKRDLDEYMRSRDIILEYKDSQGLPMTEKEAFKALSHKFHGKDPSKNKRMKYQKKKMEEMLANQGLTTEKKLVSMAALSVQQKSSGQAFVVLDGSTGSGQNRMAGSKRAADSSAGGESVAKKR